MVWFVQDGVVRKEVGDNVEEFWENVIRVSAVHLHLAKRCTMSSVGGLCCG